MTPSDTFNCLQFSGTVRETESSSSTNAIDPSPSSVPVIIPSSPSGLENSDENVNTQRRPQEWSIVEESFTPDKESEKQPIVRDTNVSTQTQNQEYLSSKTSQQKEPLEEDEDEDIVLPKWNQELLQREKAKEEGKKPVSTIPTVSPESSSNDSKSDKSEKQQSYHQWQSQGLTESGCSYSGNGEEQGKMAQPDIYPSLHLSDESENQSVALTTNKPIPVPPEQESSLSPSSVVLEPIGIPQKLKDVPTQPELSHDIFQQAVQLSQGTKKISHKQSPKQAGTCNK